MGVLRRLALALAIGGLAGGAVADAPTRVAVFDFELLDSSLEGEVLGPNPDETRRTERLGDQLRETISAAPGYVVSDIEPVRAQAKRRWLQRCGACDVAMARELEADWSVTGTVQKVSNLILNINVYVRDVASGELIQAMSADIRSNTDQSWRRGLDWLIRHRLELAP
jgi:hypothetical protein